MSSLLHTTMLTSTLILVLTRPHVIAVPASPGTRSSAEDDSRIQSQDVEDRLKPLMKILFSIPTTSVPENLALLTLPGLRTHRSDCRKWDKLNRQWLLMDRSIEHHPSLSRLVEAVRGLCYELSGVRKHAHDNGDVDSLTNVKRDGGQSSVKRDSGQSSDDYTDSNESWGAVDTGNESYGSDIGSPKGSWRRNVMRVWGK